MKGLAGGLTAALALAAAWPAAPQGNSSVDEIVVTAAKRDDGEGGGVPGVFVARRADNLLMEIRIVCDTRDAGQRLNELRQTLRNLIRGQRPPSIALGVGEGMVGTFDEAAIDDVITGGGRPDTSAATLLVKTRIEPGDTVDDAVRRIRDYAERTAKVGRTEIIVDEEVQLSIVGLAQYRPQVLAAIAADARAVAAALGDDYGVTLEGLEAPVGYVQSGPLEARLFIPYSLEVQPKPG